MFTGIIRKISKIEKTEMKNGSLFVAIGKPKDWRLKLGDSISINGVCSTVHTIYCMNFEVEYMKETRNKTTVNEWQKGDRLNLEKSLRMNDLLDGHIVMGHIDSVGKIIGIKNVGNSRVLKVGFSRKLMKYIVSKGSVALDGVSLTVVSVGNDWFTVSLVSYTLENTNLKKKVIGDNLNVETDVLGKYVRNRL